MYTTFKYSLIKFVFYSLIKVFDSDIKSDTWYLHKYAALIRDEEIIYTTNNIKWPDSVINKSTIPVPNFYKHICNDFYLDTLENILNYLSESTNPCLYNHYLANGTFYVNSFKKIL